MPKSAAINWTLGTGVNATCHGVLNDGRKRRTKLCDTKILLGVRRFAGCLVDAFERRHI